MLIKISMLCTLYGASVEINGICLKDRKLFNNYSKYKQQT